MESANKPLVKGASKGAVIEFLPDADEIERTPLPRAARVTMHSLMAMLLVFLLWATFSEVDKVVVAPGHLITPLPNIVVQPLETSIIQGLSVRVGQIVHKGDLLATLDPTFTEADQSQLLAKKESLANQIERLEGELAGSPVDGGTNSDSRLQARLSGERLANYQAQLRRLAEAVGRQQAAIETNLRDQQMQAARIKPLQEIEAMEEKLAANQFGAKVLLLKAQDRRMEVERDLQIAALREQELRRELAVLEAEKLAFERGWRQRIMEELLETRRTHDEVSEHLQKAARRNKLVTLAAPADAVVLEMAKLSPGSVAKGAEPLMVLVPMDVNLEAEVEINALDVGYVKIGDKVRLKFAAFPFQKHGTLGAQVRTLSEDSFRRQGADTGPTSYYLSRLTIGKERMKQMPDQARLLPGMALTAEILVGKRTVLSYLLWPLTKALDESIQEP